jgi:DNA-binding response OmpR family regulator
MRKGTLATLDVPRPVSAPRILVVDDEPRIRDFVSRALTAAGYFVEVACDGASAMARAAGGGFALVVLDLVMPGRRCWPS